MEGAVSMEGPLRVSAGILTVSDACSRGEREDSSGAALRRLVRAQGWTVAAAATVPDEKEAITRALRAWCDERRLPVVLTTGGTGIGPRDVTPEATRALLDRELPGLAELMRAEGLKSTPMAALSRAAAGTRGGCLVVNLPGSPAGAEESFRAVAQLIPHALHVLAGGGHGARRGKALRGRIVHTIRTRP